MNTYRRVLKNIHLIETANGLVCLKKKFSVEIGGELTLNKIYDF